MAYYADSDSNGNIIGYYTDTFKYSNGIPKTAIKITDEQWNDSMSNDGKYIVQGGALVLAPPPTLSQQLSKAQSDQLFALQIGFEQAILSGFTSSASGTASTYALDANSMAKWNGTLGLINSGKVTGNIIVKDINGNKVTLTTDQFKQFALDGFNYYNAQEQQLWQLEQQVESITTDTANCISAVQEVVWTTATAS